MTITEALVDAGVQVDHMNKPQGNPTKDGFARVIHALRDVEAKAARETAEANKRAQEALARESMLTARCAKLEAELLRLRLSQKLDGSEKLSLAEKSELLALTQSE